MTEYSYQEVIDTCRTLAARYMVLGNDENNFLERTLIPAMFIRRSVSKYSEIYHVARTHELLSEILPGITIRMVRESLNYYIQSTSYKTYDEMENTDVGFWH